MSTQQTDTDSWPLPVPKAVRTRRTFGRVIAFGFVLAWIVAYGSGTQALARLFDESRRGLDGVLEVGSRTWGVFAATDDEHCIGYIESVFNVPLRPELLMEGSMFLPLHDIPREVELEILASFDEFYKLTSFSSRVSVGTARVITISEDANVNVSVETTEKNRQFQFTRPSPIFLIEQTKNHYGIRLPKQWRTLFQESSEENLLSSKITGVRFTELSEDSVNDCKKQLVALATGAEYPEGVIDIGTYLHLLNIGTSSAKDLMEAFKKS